MRNHGISTWKQLCLLQSDSEMLQLLSSAASYMNKKYRNAKGRTDEGDYNEKKSVGIVFVPIPCKQ